MVETIETLDLEARSTTSTVISAGSKLSNIHAFQTDALPDAQRHEFHPATGAPVMT